ncbi:hypothetical protein FACS189465_2660 [Clostridia bacterium]|nr:hypothetical protein FACS189465_2660 [Clostridia bacterium]
MKNCFKKAGSFLLTLATLSTLMLSNGISAKGRRYIKSSHSSKSTRTTNVRGYHTKDRVKNGKVIKGHYTKAHTRRIRK